MLVVWATAAESDFYVRFTEASRTKKGFLWDISLVQTNNPGPILTNTTISWSKFADRGELAGIKLGMTMSEVVSAWGKPHLLLTYCVNGDRFWYGTGSFGNLALSFRSNNLVLIAITGRLAERVTFDNGLTGRMGLTECEALLGTPTLRAPDAREGLWIGEIAYRAGNIRTDIAFKPISPGGSDGPADHLRSIAICLESEAVRQIHVEK